MAAEFIDDTLDGSGQFPTKIPGYEDAADIQEALRLYHYGAATIPATPTQINPKSIAGYLKQLQTNINNVADGQSLLAGVGIDWNTQTEQYDIDSTVATKANVASLTSIVTKASNFTLELVDASKTILLNTSSSMTLTIPLNSSVAIPIGYQFHFIEIGSGRTTFSPASGVTVGSKNSQLFLDGTYSRGTLVKIATDAWVLYGDVYEGVASTTAAPTTTTAAPVVTTTTPAPVVTTTTGAPPSFPFFAPATTTTVAPPVATTTTTGLPPVVTTTTTGLPPVVTTTTVAPSVSFTTLPYETNVTHNSFKINWVAANAGSWRVYDGGTTTVYGEGNGNPTSFSRTGLTPSSQYTQTVKVWTGANFTGTSVSDAITVGTNMDPNQSYWATGCCSTSGTQVTGDSSVGASFALADMNSRCVGGTVTNIQTGSNSAVPVLTTCGLTVPNVVGSSLSVATSTLSENGFVYAAGTATTVGATSSNNGLVASQTPTGGTIAAPGSTVTLSTYNYVAATTTTVAPTTTTVAPTTTTAAPTYTRNETRSVSSAQCPSLNGYYAVTYANSNYTGEISATFLNCIEVATTTTSAPTTTTAAPAAFDVVLSSKTSTTANVSWSGAPALTVVYEVDINGGSVTNPSSTSRSFSGLTPNTSYTVTVKAKNSSFSTLATDSVTFTTDAVATTTTSAPATTTTAAPTYSRQETRYAGQCLYGEGIYNVTYANSNYTGEISSTFLNCIEVTTTTTSAPVVTTTTSAPVVTTTTSAPVVTTTTSAPVVTTTTSAPVVTTTTSAPVVTTTTSAPVVTTTTSAPVVTTTTSAPVVTTTTTTAAPTGFKICTSLDVANSFCYIQGCDNGGCGNGNSCSVGQNRCSAQ